MAAKKVTRKPVKPSRKAHTLRDELYRKLVFEAAEQEFAAHGYANARMQRVAERVGLSVGTLYNLFESKDELYAAIHEQRGRALVERVMNALAIDAPLLERLASSLRAHIEFAREHPNYLRMLLRRGNVWSSPEAHAPGLERRSFQHGVELATALCQAAIERGELRADDPRRMVLTLTGVHQAQLQHWFDAGMPDSPGQLADGIIELFRRMYAP